MMIRVGLIIALVLLFTQCTMVSDPSSSSTSTVWSPYTLPARAYLAMADKQTGEEQASLLIMASGRYLQEGQWQKSQAILTSLVPTTVEISDEKKLLQAKIAWMKGEADRALALLSSLESQETLSVYEQVQYHDLLAQIYQKKGQWMLSMTERMKLDPLLPDETLQQNNRRTLWLSLMRMPLEELETATIETSKRSVLQGWLKLALISRAYTFKPNQMLEALVSWQARFPHHPGLALLPASLEDMREQLYPVPHNIALLLPLTGLLSGPGLAIKEGFLAAFEASGASKWMRVQFYDTNTRMMTALYEQAYADGAQLILGPLTKQEVAEIATVHHPVPTVLLNEVRTPLDEDTYQFGLSPELEARQVAVRARKDGYQRAILIYLDNPWGESVAHAFEQQWVQQGGRVVDTLRYQPTHDLHAAIQSVLHLGASERRIRDMKSRLGLNLEATPHRRQDMDVIFLVAYPSAARQIKPLLNYYYAGDVPVYATSSVYSGSLNTMQDRDLNGIIFSDVPWVFTHHLGHKNWPENWNSYSRLYALGVDSFLLTTTLNALKVFPAVDHEGEVLYLSDHHQIARILTFGMFQNGQIQRLQD